MLQVLPRVHQNWHWNCERGFGLVTLKIAIRLEDLILARTVFSFGADATDFASSDGSL